MPTYRKASTCDLGPICQMAQEVNRSHHEALPQIFPPTLDPERLQSEWQEVLDSADCAAFVALEQSAVIGFVSVQVVNETHHFLQPARYAWVGVLCVAKQQRGQGIGRALVSLVESWASERGAIDLRSKVWSFNAASVRLCEEMGWETRALEMCKTLVPQSEI